MKHDRSLNTLACFALVMLATGGTPAIAGPQEPATHQHEAHAHEAQAHETQAAPAAGARFVPDAPLVAGMLRIKAAAAGLAKPGDGAPDAARVLAHVDAIKQAIDTIFAECRLAPEPDAALHPVLAKLLGATNALRADPADADAVAAISTAVGDYERLFGALP